MLRLSELIQVLEFEAAMGDHSIRDLHPNDRDHSCKGCELCAPVELSEVNQCKESITSGSM